MFCLHSGPSQFQMCAVEDLHLKKKVYFEMFIAFCITFG